MEADISRPKRCRQTTTPYISYNMMEFSALHQCLFHLCLGNRLPAAPCLADLFAHDTVDVF